MKISTILFAVAATCHATTAIADQLQTCVVAADGKTGEARRTFMMQCLKGDVPNLPVQAPGEPFIKEDRFEGTTQIISGAPLDGDKPGLQFLAVLKGKHLQGADLGVFSHSDDWRYLKCRSLHFLVDGKPLQLPQAKYDGDVGYAGHVTENFWMHVGMATYRQLAKAGSIEYKVCNDEMAVSEEGMLNLRGFVRAVEERTK